MPEGSEVLRLVKIMKKCIITISRNYGAGAGEVGRRLSADLNIPFYDKEILHLASHYILQLMILTATILSLEMKKHFVMNQPSSKNLQKNSPASLLDAAPIIY